jgi:hypothetical protein
MRSGQAGLADGHGALEQGTGGGKVALVAHDDGEVVESLGGARMVRPRSGLIDCQGGLVEGAGGVGVALVVQNRPRVAGCSGFCDRRGDAAL